jgi:RHS repeat-associated protein
LGWGLSRLEPCRHPPAKAATTQNGTVEPTWYYTYDAASQLASACQTSAAPSGCSTGSGGQETAWTYDKAGNILTVASAGQTIRYTHNAAEQLTKATTGTTAISYGYDADGDLTNAGTSTYTYNGAGELAKAATSAGTYTYTYDAAGNLSAASHNGTLTQTTIWDLNNPLALAAEQTSATGATTADLLYNPNNTLSAMTTPAGAYYATTNWLGSVTGLVSSAGAQVSSTTYTPYGTEATTGSPLSPIGYAGSYTLPGSGGLDDMHARDYNPATATFTSADPLQAQTGQPYAYADDDPVTQTDPTGTITCPGWIPGCGIVTNVQNAVSGAAKQWWQDWWVNNPCGSGGQASIFLTTPRGATYQIPSDWVAREADNGKGIVFQQPGAEGNADSIRIMEPTELYPNGYAVVYNSLGQPVDNLGSPGNPLGRAATHLPEDELGDFPELPIL